MNKQQLKKNIQTKASYLCIGLDTDPDKIPAYLKSHEDPVFEFNRQIIHETHSYAVAYKINTAFYEAQGLKGWLSMEKTINAIPKDCLIIADAKRGDIGNTASQYAKTFYETYRFDAVTLSPYMGSDSIEPWIKYKDKWSIVLGLTSNKGAEDVQQIKTKDGRFVYQEVMEKVSRLASEEQIMFVVGATRPDRLAEIRKEFPDFFFLVPGVGTQGGDLNDISRAGLNADIGLLINVSRAIIYAGNDQQFAKSAADKARFYQSEMKKQLETFKLL